MWRGEGEGVRRGRGSLLLLSQPQPGMPAHPLVTWSHQSPVEASCSLALPQHYHLVSWTWLGES